MTQIIVTETQLKNLTRRLNEDSMDSKYRMECKADVDYYKVMYNGMEIEYVYPLNINVNFDIDLEGRSYGIKSVSVYNIVGPSEVEMEIEYYPENSDDSVDETVVVPLNWDNVVIDKDENLGYIGIGDIIQISLKNDESGKIVCDTITVSSFSI
jgi:inner membrane protein involved in colicin E2 resistance